MDIRLSLRKKGYRSLMLFYVYTVMLLIMLMPVQQAAGQGSPDDSYWDNIFSRPQSSVAVAVKDAGYAVFAGVFRIPHSPVIGGNNENRFLLSIWDKDHWVLTGQVKQILDYSGSAYITAFDVIKTVAIDQNSIYIGGNFQIITMQGDTCFNIAQWYGNQWHPVEKGIDGTVETIALTGNGDFYVGGTFYNLKNGTLVNNIAHWNGTSWSTLDDNGGAVGVNGKVNDIAVGTGGVYVGGEFTTAGGQNVNYVAGWNWGTHAWKALADGVNNYVLSVAAYGRDVYIGGYFTEAFGGDSISSIAKLTDTNSPSDKWVAIGQNKASHVFDVKISPAGNLYAVGDFSVEAGNNAKGFAMWDGMQWKAFPEIDNTDMYLLPSSTKMAVTSTTTNDVVYMCFMENYIKTINGKQMQNYCMWDGSHWHGLGYGVGSFFDDSHPGKFDNKINDLAWGGSFLYAGGSFEYIGDDSIRYLAKWDPAALQWSRLGTSGLSLPGAVKKLIYHNNALYIGGDFESADGIKVNNIVKWDGNKFIALGQGLSNPQYNAQINDMVFINDTLFAIGDEFFNTENNIAFFDGTSWHPFTSIPSAPSYGDAISIAYYQGKLYAMSRNGSVYEYDKPLDKWNEIGSSSSFPTYTSLHADKNYLYACGNFSEINNVSANNIARWDGTTWSAMGAGFNDPVYDIYTNGNDIYASGDFLSSGDDTLWCIARWNGTKWVSLGSGIRRYPIAFNPGTGNVTTMIGTPYGLYVGGTFNYAGSDYSNNLALWKNFNLTGISNMDDNNLPDKMYLYQNYPNPFNPTTKIRYSIPSSSLPFGKGLGVRLIVYDILGREVTTLVNKQQQPGNYEVDFNASKLSSGVYFYRLSTGNIHMTKKLLLLK